MIEPSMTDRLIAYQGEPGANSHIACLNAYPAWTPLPCATFEDALAAVTEGRARLAMIPIENSIAGRVADIHTLLPASGLFIVAEYFLPIRFQLLGIEGSSLETITSVYSHVHALGQCRRVIRAHNLKAVVTADTAGSAREVRDWADPTRASLATKLAAEIYGLRVLQADVEDEKHNTTRFVVLSGVPEWPSVAAASVTTFVFRVRNVPAALYKALGGFATNGVNMTKLESYMGHPYGLGLARAMEELAFFCEEIKVLGVYPAHPDRAGIGGEAAKPGAAPAMPDYSQAFR
jgi:prephenate dehydratase